MTGTVISNPPGGLFDRSSFRCIGMSTALGGRRSNSTLCEAIDPDGDKRLTLLTLVDGRTIRENLAGTGKYDGMIASGDVHRSGDFRPRSLEPSRTAIVRPAPTSSSSGAQPR